MGCRGSLRDNPLRPRDRELAERIKTGLIDFERRARPLPGIREHDRRECLCEQLLESVHRVELVRVLRTRQISDRRADPHDGLFDPLKAAILQQRRRDFEEAFWLIFMFVHFGKHARGGWRYAREVYGRLGDNPIWSWKRTSNDPAGFRDWLAAHEAKIRRPGVPGGFGNHRKYETLDARSPDGTGAVVESYVSWVVAAGSHRQLVGDAVRCAGDSPEAGFDKLYHSMRAVARFGRLARFDYLAMLGKLELAPIKPGRPYLEGSSGPLHGARLLFGGEGAAASLEAAVVDLGHRLGLGMQVLEDALCNWNKSPCIFKPFRS